VKDQTAEKQIPLFFDPKETVESAGAQTSSTEKRTKRIERRGVESGILVGTAAFAKAGEAGDPYAKAPKPAEYITHYANHFPTVELDTTFYATPTAKTVRGWYEKTPEDFVFAAKVPKAITHDKVLLECEEEFTGFVKTMDLLEQKLGPMLLQFGYFNKNAFKCGADFLALLQPFLKKLPKDHKFAVEAMCRGAGREWNGIGADRPIVDAKAMGIARAEAGSTDGGFRLRALAGGSKGNRGYYQDVGQDGRGSP